LYRICKPFERSRRHSRRISHAQTARLLGLLFIVLLCQCAQLGTVLFFYCTPLPIELLYIIEPCDSVAHPGADGLERILSYVGHQQENTSLRIWPLTFSSAPKLGAISTSAIIVLISPGDQVMRETFSGSMASAEPLRQIVALSFPIPAESCQDPAVPIVRRVPTYPTTTNWLNVQTAASVAEENAAAVRRLNVLLILA
jgi:hypothetical protein